MNGQRVLTAGKDIWNKAQQLLAGPLVVTYVIESHIEMLAKGYTMSRKLVDPILASPGVRQALKRPDPFRMTPVAHLEELMLKPVREKGPRERIGAGLTGPDF